MLDPDRKKAEERLKKEDPVEKFKDILSTLILQGKVGLEGKNNSLDILGNKEGEFVGYHDENFLYLVPSAILSFTKNSLRSLSLKSSHNIKICYKK